MKRTLEELMEIKDDLEKKLSGIVNDYERQLRVLDTQIQRALLDAASHNEIDEPQDQWNVEHEGLISRRGDLPPHLYEREQIYENQHE